jgi:hypothetical protein
VPPVNFNRVQQQNKTIDFGLFYVMSLAPSTGQQSLINRVGHFPDKYRGWQSQGLMDNLETVELLALLNLMFH